MGKRFIVTAIGKDRPGFIADVSGLIYENGCNLEDSTMTSLSDEFAMIFMIEGPEEKPGEAPLEERLLKECRRLEKEKGISAFVRAIKTRRPVPKKATTSETLHVQGLDQAGIVYKISRYLADNGINITSFESRMTRSPETGAAMYTIDIQIQVPDGMTRARLDDGLTQIGNELNVDISMG
ncbi:MAG: hypothetical protein JRI80_15470 [Deltaproteobacteria bacterium]|nr:hypothetical protein [Deltaproteobacteria bacterium]